MPTSPGVADLLSALALEEGLQSLLPPACSPETQPLGRTPGAESSPCQALPMASAALPSICPLWVPGLTFTTRRKMLPLFCHFQHSFIGGETEARCGGTAFCSGLGGPCR